MTPSPEQNRTPYWHRVDCFGARRFWDALCAYADRGWAGLRRLFVYLPEMIADLGV
jgi:hypothetical protein